MNFYENIKHLCQIKKGMTLSAMVKELGMSTSFPNKWQNGQIPNGETLIKLADFLDESIDRLLGRELKTEPTILAYSGNERINSIAKEILKTDLADDDLNLIEFILDKYKK